MGLSHVQLVLPCLYPTEEIGDTILHSPHHPLPTQLPARAKDPRWHPRWTQRSRARSSPTALWPHRSPLVDALPTQWSYTWHRRSNETRAETNPAVKNVILLFFWVERVRNSWNSSDDPGWTPVDPILSIAWNNCSLFKKINGVKQAMCNLWGSQLLPDLTSIFGTRVFAAPRDNVYISYF